MTIKILRFLMISAIIVGLAACSAQAQNTSAQTNPSSSNAAQQQNPAANLANQPLEDKLAIGTLKLEGTDKAVTADQAKTLLPLWKAVKSISASTITSTSEMNALYKQIQEAMTADQVQAIKDLSLSQTDLQALITQYGVKASQGGPLAQETPQARAGSGNAQTGGAPADGGPPLDGGMPPDAGVGGATTGSGQVSVQRTPRAGQSPRGMRGGMNILLVDPLIKLLTERAG